MNSFRKSSFSKTALSLLLAAFATAAIGATPAMAGDGSCVADYTKQFPASPNQFYATGDFVSYSTNPSMNGKSYHIGTWEKGSEPGFPVPFTPSGTTYWLNASDVIVSSYIGPKAFPTAYRGDFTTSSKVDVWTVPAKENSFWWYVSSNKTLAGHPAPPVYSGTFTNGALSGYTQAERDAGLYPGWYTESHMRTDTAVLPPFSGGQVTLHIDPQQYATRFIVKNVFNRYLQKFDYSYSPDINVPDSVVLAAATSNAAMLTKATIDRLRGYIDSGNVGRNYLDLTPAAIIHNDSFGGLIGGNFAKVSAGDESGGCGLFAEIVKHPRLQNVYMLKYFIKSATIIGLAPFNRRNDAGTFIAYAPYLISSAYVAPTIRADAVTTRWDQPIAIQPLDNDTEGSVALSLKSVSSPARGTASKSGSTVTYTPEAGWVGTVTMTYVATDGTTDGSAAITVTVVAPPPPPNVAPILSPDAATTNHNSPISLNVLANDYDPDNGPDPLTVTDVTQPERGSVTWAANGLVVYTPVSGYTGPVTMTYTASDGVASATSTITITTEACYEDVWRDSKLICSGGQQQGSADFQQGCTFAGPGYDTIEVLCPAH